jgi:hypothetical protein
MHLPFLPPNPIAQRVLEVFGDFLSHGKVQMEYRFNKKKGHMGIEQKSMGERANRRRNTGKNF